MREINEVALLSGYGKEELTATPFMIARMRLLAKNRDRIVVLNGQHGDPVFTHKATVLMHDLFRERTRSFFKDPMDLEFYLAFVLAGHHNMIQFWLEKMPEVAPEKTAAYLNLLFNAGLFISQTELGDCPSFAAKAHRG